MREGREVGGCFPGGTGGVGSGPTCGSAPWLSYPFQLWDLPWTSLLSWLSLLIDKIRKSPCSVDVRKLRLSVDIKCSGHCLVPGKCSATQGLH